MGWARIAIAVVVGLAVATGGDAGAGADDLPAASGGLAGQLLVATPEMPDPRFAETVIYMVEHSTDGAMGLVVNRPVGEIPLAELLEELGLDGQGASGSVRLHQGGPVRVAHGLVLHSPDYVVDGTLVVDHGLALTTRPKIVEDIASGAGPRRILVAFGYAGWGAGQLEAEIAAGAWVTIPSDDALVFDDVVGKWRRAMARHGIEL